MLLERAIAFLLLLLFAAVTVPAYADEELSEYLYQASRYRAEHDELLERISGIDQTRKLILREIQTLRKAEHGTLGATVLSEFYDLQCTLSIAAMMMAGNDPVLTEQCRLADRFRDALANPELRNSWVARSEHLLEDLVAESETLAVVAELDEKAMRRYADLAEQRLRELKRGRAVK